MELISILKRIKNTFDKVGGDAIDLSWFKCYLKDINAKNIFDKAVSAGEQTNLKINNQSLIIRNRYCK